MVRNGLLAFGARWLSGTGTGTDICHPQTLGEVQVRPSVN